MRIFKLRETNINLDNIYSEIGVLLNKRKELGVYEHFDFSGVNHYYLKNAIACNKYINALLEVLPHSWAIDINDFQIIQKKKGFVGRIEILLKKIIWKLLKFYTFRIISQQREFNYQVSSSILLSNKILNKKIETLEQRIKSFY